MQNVAFFIGNAIVLKSYGAGNGARTRGIKLGKLALYQLSYARMDNILKDSWYEINIFQKKRRQSTEKKIESDICHLIAWLLK